MKKIFAGIVLFACLAHSPRAAMAEPAGGYDRDIDRPPSKEDMERVRKKIETMRMWKLTSSLDLDEKTTARLFPVLGKFDRKRAESEASLRDGIKELRDALKERNEAKLKPVLERMEQAHKGLQRINDEERTELKKILTVEQQAKFVLFQHEFNREVRDMIGEARDRRGAGPGRDQRPVPRDRYDRDEPGRPVPGRDQ